MSYFGFAWTFPARESELDERGHSLEGVSEVLNARFLEGRCLTRYSEDNWVGLKLFEAAAMFDLAAVKTLCISSRVFNEEDVSTVNAELVSLLRLASTSLKVFAQLLNDDEEFVAKELETATVSMNPGELSLDGGVGAGYFFAYVKSLLAVFSDASSRHCRVVHIQYAD